jgi:GNAT superfamily N-acetyltransferase
VSVIRRCRPDEHPAILAIVNEAAERYRGAIPADCWHEPYMSAEQLERDVDAGVEFWGSESDSGLLAGVMGIQPVKDVELIRHAYVRPELQGKGFGGELLRFLEGKGRGRILIGTWAAASWAIAFYQRHGYTLVPTEQTAELLRTYWSVSPRQVETSVVLAKPPIGSG